MIKATQASLLLLALVFAALPVMAQHQADEATGSSASAARDNATEQPAATPETPADRESAPNSSSADTSGRSPFDYRSSEEISEDVPVSFPVDI